MLLAGSFVGGPCDGSVGKTVVRAPWDGTIVGTAAEGGESELRAALDAANEAFPAWRESSRRKRQTLLRRVAALVRERREELSELLAREVGKPITLARGETDRLAVTFDLGADALADWGLESAPLDLDPRGGEYRAVVQRFPLGVVFGIVPYNWPLNLAAHKLVPALAAGNTVVLKPSGRSPLSTLLLAHIVHEAGCPPGVLNVWNGPSRLLAPHLASERVAMVSFTGSPRVGWGLKRDLPEKRVSLELGGDATAIVAADADLDWALRRCVEGAFNYAGQICISIQHLLVERAIYDSFRERLVAATEDFPTGYPLDPTVLCGPLVGAEAVEKVEGFVNEALADGARLLTVRRREGNVLWPMLMEGVPETARLAHEEVFGPVVTLEPFDDWEAALARVNRSRYGIHAGVFTRDAGRIERAFRTLEVGGVVANDYPTLRFDALPYGGVKRSGFGREGVRWAMDEMSELKTLVTRVV